MDMDLDVVNIPGLNKICIVDGEVVGVGEESCRFQYHSEGCLEKFESDATLACSPLQSSALLPSTNHVKVALTV